MDANFKLFVIILLASWCSVNFVSGDSDPSPPAVPNNPYVPDDVAHFGPPKSLETPIVTYPRILISGGPSNPFPASQMAFQMPTLSMFENATIQIMNDIKEGLKYVFQTKNEYTLALPGHGHVAMEVLLDNILEPKDVILVPINGMWGKRVSDMADRYGAVVRTIEKPLGQSFTLKELEDAIKLFKPIVLFLIHGESSTGVIQRIEGAGALCRKYECLLVVDIVATVSIYPFHFDKWEVDAAYCNCHKGIGAPVGLAPITIGPRAIAKMLNRDSRVRSYRADIKNWIATNYWNIDERRVQSFHHSLPVLLFYTLREALALIAKEKLENAWDRHENVTNRMYEGLEEMKLEYFVPDKEDRLRGTIMLNPPEGISPKDMQQYFRETHGMDLGIGLGPTYGKQIRIGLMETNANLVMAERILAALKDTLIYFQVVKNITVAEAPPGAPIPAILLPPVPATPADS